MMSSIAREGCYPVRPMWRAAVDKFYKQLDDGGIKRTSMISEVLWKIESPDVLIEETQKYMIQDSHNSYIWTTELPKLKPILSDLNDFAAITACSAGMDNRVAVLLWGSMTLLFKFAHSILLDLIPLIEELRAVLPKACISEKEFAFSESLETTLLNMYTEIIVFYGYAIVFFRNNHITTTDQHIWSIFRSRFGDTLTHLRLYSMKVDKTIDMTRLSREPRGAEPMAVVSSSRTQEAGKLEMQCHVVPYGINLKFRGRTTEIDKLKNYLDPRNDIGSLKVMSIYGLGGVGKTQLALQFVNISRDDFEVIAWIQANTHTRFMQSLLNFASTLGLPVDKGSDNDDYQLVQKVKSWLNKSRKTFLLIFDNLEDDHILTQIWPASNTGSIIITSRSLSVAAERTEKVMQLKSFEKMAAVNILYGLSGLQPANHKDEQAAEEICQIIGGHALAIAHMSSFIRNRGYSYEEFLAFYHRHAEKIFVRHQPRVDYDHTLSTVWDSSLRLLSSNAKNLLNLLSLFDCDSISESLFVENRAEILESRLRFLTDEFDFGDALSELIAKTSFVSRLITSKSLHLHRLVKSATLTRIPRDEHRLYLDNAIQLLFHAFPNTWDQRGTHQGHCWCYWETCSAVVPHLSSLMGLQRQYNLQTTNPETFAELVFRIGTYLWENEQPTAAKSFIEYGLRLDISGESRLCAQAFRLLGNVNLDMARPRAALDAHEKALEVRMKIEEADSPAIAEVYDSIACSHVEIGDVSQAFGYLAKADAISSAHLDKTSARTQAMYSLAHLRANQPDEALDALQLCWQLQGKKTQQEIAESRCPKHSGDILLLARIQHARGEKHQGQQLASRSINIRRGLFRSRGPRVADSTFLAASMLAADGELVVAARMYEEVIDMSRGKAEMNGHLARACWFLASTEELLNNPTKAERLREDAREERARIQEREVPDEDTDEAFMGLVGWMLW